MAKLGKSYVADDMPKGTGGDFSPIPNGWYGFTITESDLKDTKAGTGTYIKLRFDVTGPSHQGRVIFGNINLTNPNPKAEEIGAQQLGELLRAVGLPKLEDTDQLIGKAGEMRVVTKVSEQYGDSNEVKNFRAKSGASLPATGGASAPAVGANKAPWEK
jgi:hypothetical protein